MAPPPPPPPTPPAAAPATCADVAVILREPVVDDDGELGEQQEEAIRATCLGTRWPAAVLDCVASQREPRTCLTRLSEAQRTALANAHAIGATSVDGDIDDVDAISCEDAIRAPDLFAPPVADDVPERTWMMGVLRKLLLHECDHGWSEPLRACLAQVTRPDHVDACMRAELEPAEADEIRAALTEVSKLAAKIGAARKKPATVACKNVVAAHYGDAKWRAKLDGFKSVERKQIIERSRARMLSACTKDAWDELLRACIFVGGERTCFESYGMAKQWGYPAAGSVTSLGIADCDEYGAAVARITACASVSQQSRDSLKRAFEETQAHMASLPAAERARNATSCRAGRDAVVDVAVSAGC